MVRFPVIVLGVLLASPASAQTRGRDWSPTDRTVIGDFTRITSVAAAQDKVYVTSPSGLLIWNPQFRNWGGPIVPPEPGMLDRVFTSLVDPLDNSLWLARLDGWVHYDPAIQLWERGSLPQAVQEIAFDLNAPVSGLFLRSGNEWYVVPRGGNAALPAPPPARPLRPTSVQDAIVANPTLQSTTAQVLLDNRLATARLTSAARSFDGLGWYIGTWGVGLLYLQEGGIIPQRLTFGLPGTLTSALYAAPGGIWVSTDRTANTASSLSFVASDMSGFNWIQGEAGFGLPFSRIRHIVGLNTDLWAATDAGAAQIDPEEGRIQLYDEGKGLQDNRVYTIAARRGTLALGTARGLATIRDGQVQRLAPEYAEPVYALALSAAADTIWVGTPRGVRVALAEETNLVLPQELNTLATLAEPVVALGWHGDTLVGLTQDRVIWRDSRQKSWWLGPVISSSLGRLRAFAGASGGLWVAGEQGVGFVPFNAMPAQILRSPLDIPGPPRDIAVDEDFLWIASDAGLVRFRLAAVRP
jgi:ligand-binding sensor domain-containing protein